MEKDIPCKWKPKESQGRYTCIRQNTLKNKDCNKDRDGHYIMIKRSVQQYDISFVNIYASNIGEPKYMKQILTNLKGEIDSNTVIVENFNTLLRSMGRSSR